MFPARCIRPGESPEDAHRYAGRRELIDEMLDAIRSFDHRTAKANRSP